jgi:hypothetical protein
MAGLAAWEFLKASSPSRLLLGNALLEVRRRLRGSRCLWQKGRWRMVVR